MATTDSATPFEPRAPKFRRALVVLGALVAAAAMALFVGPRAGLLLLLGLGLGITLEAMGFGFAGPWRRMIAEREPSGLVAHCLAIGLVALAAFPLLSSAEGELFGARAPIGFAMLGGAFVFGICMQLLLGCGSGTLVNAGSGNSVALLALPFFAIGSFAGSYGLVWWTGLGSLPVLALEGWTGLAVTLIGLVAVALIARRLGAPDTPLLTRRHAIAAAVIAALAVLHLIVAGQPWGVVYGLGLWAAKGFAAFGTDLTASAFWAAPGNATRLRESLLTDVTSLTNIGLIAGAALVGVWNGTTGTPARRLPLAGWAVVIVAGFLLGYSARLAFGCNVGAFFSGISTGSAHGWAWLVAGFAGSWVGIRLRPHLGLEEQA